MIFLLLAIGIHVAPLPDLTGVEPQVVAKLRQLQEEVNSHPDSATSWGKLAMNLHAHEFLTESLPCYEEARKRAPHNFHWVYYEAVALQESGSPRAIEGFQDSLKLKPDYSPAHLRLAQVFFQAGRMEESEVEFRQVLRLNSKSADSYVGLARIRLYSNAVEEARRLLLKALEFNKDQSEAHGLLSEVYRRMNRDAEADQEMIEAQQLPQKIPPPDPEMKEFLMEGVSSYWYDVRGRALLANGE
jgi:tetratricopeptide (TPR) repeat protein